MRRFGNGDWTPVWTWTDFRRLAGRNAFIFPASMGSVNSPNGLRQVATMANYYDYGSGSAFIAFRSREVPDIPHIILSMRLKRAEIRIFDQELRQLGTVRPLDPRSDELFQPASPNDRRGAEQAWLAGGGTNRAGPDAHVASPDAHVACPDRHLGLGYGPCRTGFAALLGEGVTDRPEDRALGVGAGFPADLFTRLGRGGAGEVAVLDGKFPFGRDR